MLERNRSRFLTDPEAVYQGTTLPLSASPQSPPPPGYVTPPPTGGNQPYEGGVRVPPTGGNQPYNEPPRIPPTGGNQPYSDPPRIPPTGGNQPALPAIGLNDPFSVIPKPTPQTRPGEGDPTLGSTQQPRGGFAPTNVVQDTLSQLLDPEGSYLRNARQRGIEQAAARGNRAGSSIAGGASQRAALEAVQPLLAEAMGLQRQREGFAFQGEQNALERRRDYTRAELDDWLSSRAFSRDFYGALTMMPINSAYQLNSLIQTYALENPEVYTADVISGMSNFFTQNFSQILSTYFPGLYGRGGGG